MRYQAFQYLKFLSHSTNQHGIHSPFVYGLVTKCFYAKTNDQSLLTILDYKKELRHQKINLTPFTVSDLTPSLFRTTFLCRLTSYLRCKNMIEVNTSLGMVPLAMFLENPESRIVSVENDPRTIEFTKATLSKYNPFPITFVNEPIQHAIKNLNDCLADLVFFNNNSQQENTLEYFEAFLPTVHNDTVFIFCDIYSSKKTTDTWKKIKQHPKVTVTIDTFRWGLVFFRREQYKEHFTIRV